MTQEASKKRKKSLNLNINLNQAPRIKQQANDDEQGDDWLHKLLSIFTTSELHLLQAEIQRYSAALESSRECSLRTIDEELLFKSRTCIQVEYLLIGYI